MSNTIDFRLIRQLWMFLAVAEEQHFGRAAKRLNVSQPPLTAQIKILEQSLGLQLFYRSRQGTQLSPAGAAILPAVRQFTSQVERLERVVREVASGRSGVLHVGAITSAMLETVPPLLDELKRAYPDLTVFVKEIDSVDAIPALEAGELDLAFVRVDKEIGNGILTMPLAEDRLAVALPKDHALASLPRVRLRSLAGEQMVVSSRQVAPDYFDLLMSVCRSHGLAPRVMHEVRSITSQVAYVGCGQGVALVPSSMRKLVPGNVVVRPLKERVMVVTAALVWNSNRYHPMVDEVVASLKKQATRRL
ncbi:LysR substrate-binding domain-containing protein [Burkholderia metallica]|uniref:LysR substrate-binding domain-containing protein n=1 Tax=Burkholderia metallica TaxID=488729 RepID=UPI0008415301|nr:LysR substrate-binding domain-containing protein [Burkholderia metallica]AOJ33591.1 LysR family transcriptional regulator [Burkholderia metallica]MCA8018938.1 LysR family transcriptional regulator [Burkholderia metallica]VWB18430.1 LysR family transcriptional regulator [Burkholderia metallica]